MTSSSSVLVLLFLFSVSLQFVNSEILGVSPDEEAKYVAGGEFFQCFESKEMIPKNAINDDFCDCKDGSDEPGTSACATRNGRGFYCKNKGFKPKYIHTSQVNDGICDCCDGSDEYFGFGGRCKNTCLEQGKGEIQKMKEEIAIHLKGAEKKREYIIKAQNAKPLLLSTIASLESDLEKKTAEYNQLKQQEDDAKNIETEAAALIDDHSEDYIREDEESDDIDNHHQDDNKEDENKNSETKENDNSEKLKQREEFIAKYHFSPEDAQKRHNSARSAARKASTELDAIKADLEEKQTLAKTDFGPNSEFYALSEEVIIFKTSEYQYKLHPFSKMLQGNTELGNWDGWQNGYKEMHFKRGKRCWGAGERETVIFLFCGTENKITSVTEPSTCIYNVNFETPLACSEEYAKQLQQQIDDTIGVFLDADMH